MEVIEPKNEGSSLLNDDKAEEPVDKAAMLVSKLEDNDMQKSFEVAADDDVPEPKIVEERPLQINNVPPADPKVLIEEKPITDTMVAMKLQ